MAIEARFAVIAVERGFITKEQALEAMDTLTHLLSLPGFIFPNNSKPLPEKPI